MSDLEGILKLIEFFEKVYGASSTGAKPKEKWEASGARSALFSLKNNIEEYFKSEDKEKFLAEIKEWAERYAPK